MNGEKLRRLCLIVNAGPLDDVLDGDKQVGHIRLRYDNKWTYKLAVAALTVAQLLPRAEGAMPTEVVDSEGWLPVPYEEHSGVWAVVLPLGWVLVAIAYMLFMTVLATCLGLCLLCRRRVRDSGHECFVAQPVPTYQPPQAPASAPRAPRARATPAEQRTVSTQSPCTYTWCRASKRFLPLTECQQGVWGDGLHLS